MSWPVFDPLDPQLRYCVYCNADCWPEPENQQHTGDCPTVTGIYPVTEQDRTPNGDLGACTACGDPFVFGAHYVLVSDETGESVNRPATSSTSWMVCVPCGVVRSDPRGDR